MIAINNIQSFYISDLDILISIVEYILVLFEWNNDGILHWDPISFGFDKR